MYVPRIHCWNKVVLKRPCCLTSWVYITSNILQKLTPEFCDEITSKANKILRLIKRTCGGLALVKSQLKFFSVVWFPYQAKTEVGTNTASSN